MPNVHGGEDIYENGHLVKTTMPNVHGGEDIYHDGHLVSATHANIFGGEDYFDISGLAEHGNASTILGHPDPLAISHKYVMPTLKL